MAKTKIPSNIKFMHLRPLVVTEGQGGATIAYVEDTDKHDNKVLRAAVAFCHERDNYNKYLGRVKSYGRLVQLCTGSVQPDDDRWFQITLDSDEDAVNTAVTTVAQTVSDVTGYVRQHERVAWEHNPEPLLPPSLSNRVVL